MMKFKIVRWLSISTELNTGLPKPRRPFDNTSTKLSARLRELIYYQIFNVFKKQSFNFGIIVIISLLWSTEVNAQNSDSLYHINIDMGIGPSVHLTNVDFEGQQTTQFVFTARVMWEPEHLLRIGLESGFIQLYYLNSKIYDTVYGSTDVLVNMSSVPIMAVFAMEILDNFEIIGGVGGFIITSQVTTFDNYVKNTSWSNAYEFGLSYLHPLNDKLKLGAELKSYYISHLENYDITLQFSMKYSIFSY